MVYNEGNVPLHAIMGEYNTAGDSNRVVTIDAKMLVQDTRKMYATRRSGRHSGLVVRHNLGAIVVGVALLEPARLKQL